MTDLRNSIRIPGSFTVLIALLKSIKEAKNLFLLQLVHLSIEHLRINMWSVVFDLFLKPAWQSVKIFLLSKWFECMNLTQY